MKTDKLFYEFFQLAPYALFELLGIQPGCPYRFVSQVVKASERRMDGLLEPIVPGFPHYFLEIQGYLDHVIYWRSIAQMGLFHEKQPLLGGGQWKVIILFLDRAFDPGLETLGSLYHGEMPWLVRAYLPELLAQVERPSPVLHVLRPLLAQSEGEVRQAIRGWVQDLRQTPEIDEPSQERLLSLLAQFVMQKFSHLSHKEIENMLQLTPLEETVAGREIIQEGQVSLLAQMMSHKFAVPIEEVIQQLEPLTIEDLKDLGLFFTEATSYESIKGWLTGRQTKRNGH
jgi:predicted transposase YdaD